MLDDAKETPPEALLVKVSFGIRGDSLMPQQVSLHLGLQPSFASAKGDEYLSVDGIRKRPWGVWQLRSESSVSSTNIGDHVHFVLDKLEAKRDIVQLYLHDRTRNVDIRIICDVDDGAGGYTLPSRDIVRLAALCNEFNFSFISRDEEHAEEGA